MRTWFLLLVVSSCISIPRPSGVAATGEPLRVSAFSVTERRLVARRVEDATTETGEPAGVYQLEHHDNLLHTDWSTLQGPTEIDVEDFFRIAGDPDAQDDVHRHRQQARWINRGAVAALAIGVVGLIGGSWLLSRDDGSIAGRALLATGVVSEVAGSYGFIWSVYLNSGDRRHGVSLGVAEQAAARYNATLGRRP